MHRKAATCIESNRNSKKYSFKKYTAWLKNTIMNKIHNTFPWISYLIGPSNSAPSAINFETVLLISGTVKDSIEE
jgi:hypothetical protein